MEQGRATKEVRLQGDEFARIYREGIEGPAMTGTSAVANPRAIYLGGQPGSGKSTLARSAAAMLGSDNFVHVDVDRLREMHPAYLPMIRNPRTEDAAPSAVQRDCSLWADMLRVKAMAGQRNMLVENTMRSSDQVRESVLAHRDAGYAVEARILAVHARSSEVSLSRRFELEKASMGFGRRMPLDYHELAAAGIVDTVRVIEDERLMDRVVIFDRSGRTIYENELVDGAWVRPALGAATMERHREGSYDVAEKSAIVSLWDNVLDMMQSRGATAAEVSAMEARRAGAKLAEEVALAERGDMEPFGVHQGLVVEGGLFHGRILELDVASGVAVQKVGRDPDRIARHALAKLSRVPEVGEVVEIGYRGGIGQVSEAVQVEKAR